MDAIRLARLEDLVRRAREDADPSTSLLPSGADPFFRAESLSGGDASMPAGFGVLVVTTGEGRVESAVGDPIAVRAGMALAFPDNG